MTRKAWEVNEMDTNMMELTMDEMALIDGGDWMQFLKKAAWNIGIGAACGAAGGAFAGPVGAALGAAAGAIVGGAATAVGEMITNG